MPEQLFEFKYQNHELLIAANSLGEAWEMLRKYLKDHPCPGSYKDWWLSKVCAKLSYGVFSLDSIIEGKKS